MAEFKLYDYTGMNLVYSFPIVYETNAIDPDDAVKSVEHKGGRGVGSYIVDMGVDSWELYLKGWITGADYTAVTAAMKAMAETVLMHTPYILRITGLDDFKVKRVKSIVPDPSLRNNSQGYTIYLQVNTW